MRYLNWYLPIALILVSLSFQCSPGVYTNGSDGIYEEHTGVFYEVAEALIPQAIVNTYRMRDFIASGYFSEFKKQHDDVKSIEEIYNYALWLTDRDIEQSLFIISMAALPYKKTPAKFPIFKFDLMFYFSMESDSMFKRRYNNLPSRLFPDSPSNPFGDKDKISHFFGSAFLTYISDCKTLSTITGELVEIGESIFQLEGFMDERDIKANELGADFAKYLIRDPFCRPTSFFKPLK
jgi:hypothetical protein